MVECPGAQLSVVHRSLDQLVIGPYDAACISGCMEGFILVTPIVLSTNLWGVTCLMWSARFGRALFFGGLFWSAGWIAWLAVVTCGYCGLLFSAPLAYVLGSLAIESVGRSEYRR